MKYKIDLKLLEVKIRKMKLQEDIKQDIQIAIKVWKDMLNDFMPDNIDYIFTKGSSAKKWESDMDYVPVISDVDIHVKLKGVRKKLLAKRSS